MIKLSSLLEHILDHPMKGEAIQEAKRLERIDECGQLTHLEITPDVSNTELKPLKFDDREDSCVFIEVDKHGYCRESLRICSKQRAIDTVKNGYSIVQVMQPDPNDSCPTQCVYTPEREHEWVIFNPDFVHDGICWAEQDKYGDILWNNVPYDADTIRFSSAVKAQEYITTHNITNAFPWAIPKLSEK